ncbi:phosphate/phosphite/phosphonate ABC transporter substrate-binding protein [Paraburkholderia sp. SOS3]|uniref:phosphate/phosphite/phosphonate ABC transporter substrate-binding protein n=1 Tax=Paraburkholderia sp. SOS3 TaxID=1926494 RepID=UPI0009474192|nr:PhnD/SsuA/transferrin family substrate-binding protein [Paraburkholderia sp. SOS3]APR39798.1 phosphate ABC transporter substrate-binding protein [Paraburkholderia sp. SOS3]
MNSVPWIAALPMYNVSPSLAACWRDWLADVLGIVEPAARIVDGGNDLSALWRRNDLLLSQTCGYPLTHELRDAVQLVATPCFDAPGCDGPCYSSALITHAGASFATLESLRGSTVAFNQTDSNSGFNTLRHVFAPLARGGRFFDSSIETGSHLASLQAVAERRADLAAIDCVTMAFVRDERPALAHAVRQIGWTEASPGLPLIASKALPADRIIALRSALKQALLLQPARARRLRLKGFEIRSMDDYARISELENEAIERGYARLA